MSNSNPLAAYSKAGCNVCLYAASLTSLEVVVTIFRVKPSVLLPLLQM